MKRALTILLALAIPFAVCMAAVIKGTPIANSNGSNISVRWVSDNESGVTAFEIARKSGSGGDFLVLANRTVEGNSTSYEFIDETAFKTSDNFYQYRITPLFADGRKTDPYYVTVTHQTNSVRRTWGSIKAMFR
jgi:hypothetical protein